MGAGSILQDLRYPSGVVWGNGFITDGPSGTSTAPFEPLAVLAYRGPHSRDIAKGLGWGTPSVFCDPGLLMSMMYSPQPKQYEVGFVPHYWHAPSVEQGEGLDQVRVIDVCLSFSAVAAELSACRAVISTSLHGIVAAHSFGIPWVWAKMEPTLVGDDFKFHDFMEGMRISANSFHISPEDIAEGGFLRLAKDARLPEGEHVPSKQKELLSVLHACSAVAKLPLMEERLGAESPVLAVVTSLLEIVAAALVYVLLGLVANPEGTMDMPLIGDIRDVTDSWSQSTLLLALCGFMLAFFLFRALAVMGAEYVMARVSENAAARLAIRLVGGYLRMPYSFHLHRSSAELIRNSHQAALDVSRSVFTPLVRVTAEMVLTLGILILLLTVSPLGTRSGRCVVVGGFDGRSSVFVVQPRLRRYGVEPPGILGRDTLATLQQQLPGSSRHQAAGAERPPSPRSMEAFRDAPRPGVKYLGETLALTLPRLVLETSLIWFILPSSSR